MNQVYQESMQAWDELNQGAAALYWLAWLLTGNSDLSIELAAEALASQNGSARRSVMTAAAAAVSDELAASARRVRAHRWPEPDFPRKWTLDPDATKIEFEHALLAIDILPRWAVLLCVFEGLSKREAAALLGTDPDFVATAQAIGLCELIGNVMKIRRWAPREVEAFAVTGQFAIA